MTLDSTQISLPERKASLDFLREIVARDTEAGRYHGRVATRFPPEPNGYLHIGHAKSICLNFGIAQEYGGVCHLRFDDTNPETEDPEYVAAIQRDVQWLGFDWEDKLFFASDYFEQFYQFAVQLIKDGRAYVDSLNEDEIRQYRGTVTEAGRPSPYRRRTVAENLDLFTRMRAGEFPDGAHVLRGIGDLAAGNMKMRDPLLYRIRHASHYRTGDAWCIYPMYDYAHPLEDAIERITHSICTLEFENNRAIYDWLLDSLFEEPRPHQYEFARLNLDYAITSKRKLLKLVDDKHVSGWDDPRMPTLSGMRRRGYTPEGIRLFASRIGVDKTNSRVQMEVLENAIRDDLNARAPRVMAVLRPLKLTLTNYAAGRTEWLDAPYWPRDIDQEGSRQVPLTRDLYIEQTDFSEQPPAGWTRLRPGGEVRLRNAYFIRCDEVVKDPVSGEVVELRCTYDADSLGKNVGGERKKSTAIQWVAAEHAVRVTVRLYDRLLTIADPDDVEEGKSFLDYLNERSIEVLTNSLVEPSLAQAAAGDRFQFVRHGYFIADAEESRPDALVFNRIVDLPDSFGKALEKQAGGESAGSKAARPAKSAPAAGENGARLSTGSLSDERERLRGANSLLAQRHDYYRDVLGVTPELADVLTGDEAVAHFFDAALAVYNNPKAIANWMANEVLRELKGRPLEQLPFTAVQLAELVKLVDQQAITSAGAKSVFAAMLAAQDTAGADPHTIVARLGLDQALTDADLAAAVAQVLAALPGKVAEYRAGKTSLLGMFTGQVIKATGGKAGPQAVQEILKDRLA